MHLSVEQSVALGVALLVLPSTAAPVPTQLENHAASPALMEKFHEGTVRIPHQQEPDVDERSVTIRSPGKGLLGKAFKVVGGLAKDSEAGLAISGAEALWDAGKAVHSAIKNKGSSSGSSSTTTTTTTPTTNNDNNNEQGHNQIGARSPTKGKTSKTSKSEKLMNGLNKANDAGNAVSSLVQTGESIVDAGKNMWDRLKSKGGNNGQNTGGQNYADPNAGVDPNMGMQDPGAGY